MGTTVNLDDDVEVVLLESGDGMPVDQPAVAPKYDVPRPAVAPKYDVPRPAVAPKYDVPLTGERYVECHGFVGRDEMRTKKL